METVTREAAPFHVVLLRSLGETGKNGNSLSEGLTDQWRLCPISIESVPCIFLSKNTGMSYRGT